jgi:Arc/MetJ-type ribon-helix-helix transcriptional regulator
MTALRPRSTRKRPTAAKVSISLPPALLKAIDKRANRAGETRSEVIRGAVEELFRREQEKADVEQWIRSYREQPQTEEELAWVEIGLAALADLPWDEGPNENPQAARG